MATQETMLLTDTEYQPAYGALYGNQKAATHYQEKQVAIDIEEYSNHGAGKRLEKIDYLCKAWEDYKVKQGATLRREEKLDCTDICIKAYSKYFTNTPAIRVRSKIQDTIIKARIIGRNLMISSVSRNLLHASVREAIVYLSLVAMLPFFALSIATYVTDDSKLTIEKNLTTIGISFNVVGLLFTCLDVGLYFRHHGCRLLKRIRNRERLIQPRDDEEAEYCKGLACKGMCGRGWVHGMDIIRIIVLETIFYPNLIIKMFKFIVLHESPNRISSLDWAAAVLSLFCIIVFVYLKKAYVFAKMIFSIRDIRTETKENTKVIIFFVFYMFGIMFLQLLMIATIGTRFREIHTNGTINVKKKDYKYVEKDWMLWYMIVFTWLMPVVGILNFFFSHHYWTTKLPVDIVYDMILEIQTQTEAKGKETVAQILAHLGNTRFMNQYKRLDEIGHFDKLLYPHTSPYHVLIVGFLMSLYGLFYWCMFDGWVKKDGIMALHIVTAFFGALVNIYPLTVIIPLLILLGIIALANYLAWLLCKACYECL